MVDDDEDPGELMQVLELPQDDNANAVPGQLQQEEGDVQQDTEVLQKDNAQTGQDNEYPENEVPEIGANVHQEDFFFNSEVQDMFQMEPYLPDLNEC